MKYEITILISEENFREYAISNFKDIYQIIIFEDILDHVIFFYCFKKKKTIIAAKEFFYDNFYFYKNYYKKLAKQINFSVSNYKNQKHAIILVPKKI